VENGATGSDEMLNVRFQIKVCAVIKVSLLIAAGAYYFFLDKKVAKNKDSKNAFFALARRTGWAHKALPTNRAEPWATLSCPAVARTSPASATR